MAADHPDRRLIRGGFGLALVIVICFSAFALWNSHTSRESLRWLEHTHQVQAALSRVLIGMVDAETSSRGFRVTGDAAYLDLFEPGLADAEEALRFLETLTHDNAGQARQVSRLRPLVARKISFLREQNQVRAGSPSAPRGVADKGTMDDLRAVLGEMEKAEDLLLQKRSARAREQFTTTKLLTLLSALTAIVAVLITGQFVARNVAFREETTRQMEKARAYAESIVDTVREPMVVLDRDLRVQRANKSFHEAFEFGPGEIEGKVFSEIDKGAWKNEALETLLRKAFDEDGQFENFVLQRTGPRRRIFSLNGRKLYRPGNHTGAVLLAMEDITERAHAEQIHLQFRALFESIPGLYLVLTPELKIVAVSDAYLEATMTKREQILGRELFEVFPDNPDDVQATGVSNLRASLDRVRKDAVTDTMPIQKYDVRGLDGVFEERYWSPSNSPVFGPDRQIEYIIHRAEDVTVFVKTKQASADDDNNLRTRMDRAQAEVFRSLEKVEAANHQLREANRELESFSYSVSHDLRAPLRHIDGFADMLTKKEGETLDSTSRRYLNVISDSAKRMGTLIDDLLVFSRMGRAEMRQRETSMNRLVEEAMDELKPQMIGRNIEWSVGALPIAWADPALVRLVLINLLSNAIKYTRPRDPARIEIGAQESGPDETTIFVRDNGVGFDMTYVDKLFGVFQRLHRAEDFEGTGIGLANVRRIVTRHGGRVSAKSLTNEGATFSFSLPLPPNRSPVPLDT